MSYERVMGIHVTNDVEYDKYRAGMMPILKSYGGSFGFDFKIAETLLSKTDDPINRVFTIEFGKMQEQIYSTRLCICFTTCYSSPRVHFMDQTFAFDRVFAFALTLRPRSARPGAID